MDKVKNTFRTVALWTKTIKAAHIARAHTGETFVAFIDRLVKQEGEKVLGDVNEPSHDPA